MNNQFIAKNGLQTPEILTSAITISNFASSAATSVVYVTSGGTLQLGDPLKDLYITDANTISKITSILNWDANNSYIGTPLTGLTSGQKYVNESYTYEYVIDTIYRNASIDTVGTFTGGTVNGNTLFTQNVSGGTMHLIIDGDTGYTNVNQFIEVGRDTWTGFLMPDGVSNSTIDVSYDPTTRKVTIAGITKLFVHGQLINDITTSWTSEAHATGVTTTQYLYYSHITNSYVFNSTPWVFEDAQIAAVVYDAAENYVMTIREIHGIMQPCVHREFHQTIGCYLPSNGGGDIDGYVLGSTTSADRRPLVSQTTIQDEDLMTVLPAITAETYTQFNLATSAATLTFVTGATDFCSVTGAQPNWNEYTGGAWVQTPMSNNSYSAYWLVAVPASSGAISQSKRFLWVQAQSNSSSLTTIQNLTPSSINLGAFGVLNPEFVFIAKIIVQYSSSNWRLTSVEKLVGTKISQTATSGGYLSSVAVDGVTITGNGTPSSPLVAVSGSAFTGGTVTNLQITGTLSGNTLSSDVDSIIAVRNLYFYNNFQ